MSLLLKSVTAGVVIATPNDGGAMSMSASYVCAGCIASRGTDTDASSAVCVCDDTEDAVSDGA
jgi:hypothetical protein